MATSIIHVDADKNLKIKTLDVFTGIGGIPLALSPFCSSVMYCEIDKYCQAVLTERMNSNDIDAAPIHSDIRTLHIPSKGMEIDMISGGFPCQDISCIGLQKGIVEGQRSSMFFEMMRIVDESPGIRMVFLENVGNIMMCGFSEVTEALTGRGFDMVWTTRAAGGFGAPHYRNRWFCLAVKQGTEIVLSKPQSHSSQLSSPAEEWYAKEPEKRYTAKPCLENQDESYDPMWIHRCHTLGNAVVPCVVRAVFEELLELMFRREKFAECMVHYSCPLSTTGLTAMPDSGMIVGNNIIRLPQRFGTSKNFKKQPTVKITIRQGEKLLKMDRYPTPRRGITHANTVTERTIRDLPTVLVNCNETLVHARCNIPLLPEDMGEPNNTRHKPMTYLLPNVEYIEWMMNFPRNWTRIDPSNLLYPKVRATSISSTSSTQQIVQKDKTTDAVDSDRNDR